MTPDELLEQPGRMYCETYQCNMSVEGCIQRQRNARGMNGAFSDKQNISIYFKKPGAHDINCLKCKQGKEIMENPPDETKVCKAEDCEFKGNPQPIGNFMIHHFSKKPIDICQVCMIKRRNAGRKSKKKAKDDNGKKPAVPAKVIQSASRVLEIDFIDHPEVLDAIIEIAKDELRTPQGQVLYWLKEFSLLNTKERRITDG